MIKYSRQRESIKNFLSDRCDHPTAEIIYENIRKEYPNISLGTVYRNLSLLAELGEIKKISTDSGPDRFDGNIRPHYHFFCRNCGGVFDINMESINHINTIADASFHGSVEGHITHFYGLCAECLHNKDSACINSNSPESIKKEKNENSIDNPNHI